MSEETVMAQHAPVRPATLGRAAGIDVAMVVFAVSAVFFSFFTGHDVATWRNIVFAPIVFLLAAFTVWLVVAEMRTLMRVMPETLHRGEAVFALGVAIVCFVVVGPMLLIMPFIFLGAVF